MESNLEQGPILLTEWYNIHKIKAQLKFKNKQMNHYFKRSPSKLLSKGNRAYFNTETGIENTATMNKEAI